MPSLLPVEFRPASILELGCGTGHLTRALVRLLPHADFLATDLSESMLELARATAEFPGRLSWRRLDARAPRLPGQAFDLVEIRQTRACVVIQTFQMRFVESAHPGQLPGPRRVGIREGLQQLHQSWPISGGRGRWHEAGHGLGRVFAVICHHPLNPTGQHWPHAGQKLQHPGRGQ